MEQAKKFAQQATAAKAVDAEVATVDDGAPLPKDCLTLNHINIVTDHANWSI